MVLTVVGGALYLCLVLFRRIAVDVLVLYRDSFETLLEGSEVGHGSYESVMFPQ